MKNGIKDSLAPLIAFLFAVGRRERRVAGDQKARTLKRCSLLLFENEKGEDQKNEKDTEKNTKGV
ncbi:MAG: hypothetical protein IJC26_07785 [Clostridia bacterium]|nr:hypothetical protein [Clostridia bacterium]